MLRRLILLWRAGKAVRNAPISRHRRRPQSAAVAQALEPRLFLAIHTWTGAVDNNWSTPGNWSGGVPTDNEAGGTVVVFNSTDSTVNQNIPNLTVQHLRFDAGSSITLTLISDLQINGSIEQLGLNTDSINGPGKIVISSLEMDMDIAGGVFIGANITGSFGLSKSGAGYLDLTGNSSYSAATSVVGGTLLLGAPLPNAGVPQSLYIGPNGAAVRVDSAEQINDAATVFIDSAGILLLNGAPETIAGLQLKDGFVRTFGQNAILHLNGDITTFASGSYGEIDGLIDFLGGQRKFIVADGVATPDLVVSAVVQGSNGFIKAGSGTLDLTGTSANTYSGAVQVAQGTLELGKTAGVAITGNLDIGDFLGSADTLRLLGDSQILTTSALTLASTGVFDVNGFTQTVGSLAGNGALFLGGGMLNVGANNTSTTFGGVVTAGGGTLSKVGTGALTLSSDLNNSALNLSASGGGTLVFASVTQHIRALALSNATALMPASAGGIGPHLLRLMTLGLGPTAVLNLNDNAMIVDYVLVSPLSSIRMMLQGGFHVGAWDGAGINSGAAAAHPGTAVGYGESSTLLGAAGGTFLGEEVDRFAVLLRYTLAGDANLDRHVDFNDLVHLAQNYNASGKFWTEGDFNYDGAVDFTDLVRLAQNYSAALPAPVTEMLAKDTALPVIAPRLEPALFASRRRVRRPHH